MQADPEHVHAEPREAGDDIAEDSHDHQPALPDESAPARMQSDRAPKHDQHCAIFLWVPAPESSPRLIGPDTTEDCSDKTEKGGKTNHTVSHARQRIGRWFFHRPRKHAAHDVDYGEHASENHR